jgi:DNA-binding MarR family transcriptional regulator
MSSGSQEKRADLLEELARELRQFTGLGASFFRAAAARLGMTVTDMQVMDLLESSGPTTAGQLADLTGLTTGAITGMLNRLEEAGFVRRERDPNDGRRVIVRLERGKDERHKIDSIFASLENEWDELASDYDDEQLAFLLEFLKRSNAMSRKEIVQLREVPEGDGGHRRAGWSRSRWAGGQGGRQYDPPGTPRALRRGSNTDQRGSIRDHRPTPCRCRCTNPPQRLGFRIRLRRSNLQRYGQQRATAKLWL